jgi:hypothetical protein
VNRLLGAVSRRGRRIEPEPPARPRKRGAGNRSRRGRL